MTEARIRFVPCRVCIQQQPWKMGCTSMLYFIANFYSHTFNSETGRTAKQKRKNIQPYLALWMTNEWQKSLLWVLTDIIYEYKKLSTVVLWAKFEGKSQKEMTHFSLKSK